MTTLLVIGTGGTISGAVPTASHTLGYRPRAGLMADLDLAETQRQFDCYR